MTAATTQPASVPASRPISKWKSVLRWLIPTQTDLVIYFGSLIVIIALVEPTLVSWQTRQRNSYSAIDFISTTLMMIAGCIAAIGCSLVWKKLDRRLTRHILGWCAFGLAALGFGVSNFYYSAWGSTAREEMRFDDGWLSEIGVGLGCAMVLGALAFVFGLFWFLTSLYAICAAKFQGTKAAEFSRVKMMVVIAVILFVLAKIQTFFFPQGFAAGLDTSGSAGSFLIFQIVGGLLGMFALFIFPSRILTREIRARWKWTLSAAILGAGIFWILAMSATASNYQKYSAEQIVLNWYAFQFCFLLTVMLSQSKSEALPRQAESSAPHLDSESTTRTRTRYPTFWSLAPVGLIVALITSSFLVDGGVLLDSWDWEQARKTKRIARSTNFQIQIHPFTWGGSKAVVSLNENSDSNVLNCLVWETIGIASLSGFTPEIDTSVFRGAGVSTLTLSNSTITSQQLEDLANTCTYLFIKNVEVVGKQNLAQLETITHFSIESTEEGKIAGILRSIHSVEYLPSIRLYATTSLNKDDIEAIVEVSQKIPIELDWRALKSLVAMNYQSNLPMRNIMVPRLDSVLTEMNQNVFSESERKSAIEYLVNNDISVGFKLEAQPELFWDLVFAKGTNGNPDFKSKVLRGIQEEDELADVVRKYHLAFGENENGEITDLFIPGATSIFGRLSSQMNEFQSIETLSFDPMWIIQDNSVYHVESQIARAAQTPERITGVGFEKLKRLQRLDLGSNTIVVDQNFLKRIPEIKHLDIHFEKGLRPRVDFSVCKNLESLIYFGTPPKTTANQLSGLANLKTVTVIDEGDGTLETAEKRANLAAAIGNAKVEIVSQYDYLPKPPQKFVDHVENWSTRIRKEYRDQATLPAESSK